MNRRRYRRFLSISILILLIGARSGASYVSKIELVSPTDGDLLVAAGSGEAGSPAGGSNVS